MEMAGFARAAVAGEYMPTMAWGLQTADQTTSSLTFTPLYSIQTYIESPQEQLNIMACLTGTSSGGAATAMQIQVDGAVVGSGQGCGFQNAGAVGATTSVQKFAQVTGLTQGIHTITLAWETFSGSTLAIKPATVPQAGNVSLVAWRSQKIADREMDGFSTNGWSPVCTCPTTYATLGTTASSTGSTTPTTKLLTMQVQTYAPQSALILRFVAGGKSSTTAGNPLFKMLLDGTLVCGTGAEAKAATGTFNTKMMTVVQVSAGIHTVEVDWCGGSGTGSITVGSLGQFADLMAEEVFCPNVGNTIMDTGGFCVTAYNSMNLPNVNFGNATADVAGIATNGANRLLVDLSAQATGDNSYWFVEATNAGSFGVGDNNAPRIWYDLPSNTNVTDVATSTGILTGTTQQCIGGTMNYGQAFHTVLRALQGWHEFKYYAAMNGTSDNFNVASAPDRNHASILVREINAFPPTVLTATTRGTYVN